MKIIIVGCGKVGTTVISSLVREGHDIVAVDRDSEVITDVTNVYDVMGVCGNGADSDVLSEAGATDAEMFIAATGSDELNMLACFIAGRMGAKHTIARIRNPEYNDDSLDFIKSQLEISMAINPELLAAHELFNILRFPTAVKVESFSRRNLEMIEIRLSQESVLDGVKLLELREKYKAKVLVCCVQRGDEVFIPDGFFALRSGDRIGITGSPSEMQKFLRALNLLKKQARSVFILGGSRTAYYLSGMLIQNGVQVKIVEQDKKTAEQLCDALPDAVIINGDGAKQELLLEEGLPNVDAFVSLTGMDEENILVSVFAGSTGVPKVITKINRDELIPMAEKLGLDSIVSPKQTVADVILRYARALSNSFGSNIETLYRFMDNKAEALEFNVSAESELANIPLRELRFKPNTLIGGIIRGKKTVIPGGDDCLLPGDRVVVITANENYADLSDILR